MHIVFVHYLEVKGNKTSSSLNRTPASMLSGPRKDSSLPSNLSESVNTVPSISTDSTSPTSTLTSAYEDAESVLSPGFQSEDSWVTGNFGAAHQKTNHLPLYSGYPTTHAMDNPSHQYPYTDGTGSEGSSTHYSQKTTGMAPWEEAYNHYIAGENVRKQESLDPLLSQDNWQNLLGGSSLHSGRTSTTENLLADLAYDCGNSIFEQKPLLEILQNPMDLYDAAPDVREHHLHDDLDYVVNQESENNVKSVETGNYSRLLKQSLVGASKGDEGLNKVDSFSRWINKELGEVEQLTMQRSCGSSWNVMDSENGVDDAYIPSQLQLDSVTMSPSVSEDQLFSIIDFSPSWGYSNHETEVMVTGKFLGTKQGQSASRWSCMFGEVEVPAEVLGNSVLRCRAPCHKAGLVPFYVTSSNRLACSEVREFEYRDGHDLIDQTHRDGSTVEVHLHNRFKRLLSVRGSTFSSEHLDKSNELATKVATAVDCNIIKSKAEHDIIFSQKREDCYEKNLKDMFFSCLLQRVTEDGNGPTFLDEEGQGVLHLAAALGYNWVLQPTIVSGVSIDFRDANGWTALHWAAFYGREETVAALVSLGATPGALTDPSAEFPLGRTPADLASANGHKGISGFLAESSLTTHLSSLTVTEAKEDISLTDSAAQGIQTVSERVAIPKTEDNAPHDLPLKDSLAAVCNATHAAARIHQIFRIQSFHRKQLIEQETNGLSSSDENDLALLAAKAYRLGQGEGTDHGAALCIQKKYRGWKKRKEFLLIRQRIVKIQAHVRGHQVRKKYKPIVWSVGILEKVILRWRRKRNGLRGFHQDTVITEATTQEMPPLEDDYDFLKEGRKQAEERMQKALSRVKSMAQYPEARAQYRRLLTVAEELRETKETSEMIIQGSEDTTYAEEELFDIQSLLDDDTFMSIAFE
ncbi:hypothetical protein Leryth_014195 [Lithospermum erythrorhizon]|nr:hypothetical protein Leryth_014195 [Lithospermum erythrorhizon]